MNIGIKKIILYSSQLGPSVQRLGKYVNRSEHEITHLGLSVKDWILVNNITLYTSRIECGLRCSYSNITSNE